MCPSSVSLTAPRSRSAFTARSIHGIPERDGGDHEVQAAGTVALVFIGAIADLTETVKEHRPRQRIACFSLIESAGNSAPEPRVPKPLERKQSALQPSVFSQSHCQAILTRIRRQFSQDQGGGDGPLFDRSRKANCAATMPSNGGYGASLDGSTRLGWRK
jgi:hypothetical protein